MNTNPDFPTRALLPCPPARDGRAPTAAPKRHRVLPPAMLLAMLLALLPLTGPAKEAPAEADLDTPIEVDGSKAVSDEEIVARIQAVFGEIDRLGSVTVTSRSGVVRLGGTTVDLESAQRAEQLAGRVDGVVTIENEIERDSSVERRLTPVLEETRALIEGLVRFAPLIGLALLVFLLHWFVAGRLARWRWFWERITPNTFIAELLSTTSRIVIIGVGAVAALSLLDATAFLGAFLGAAGVLGLAVGFAVRDTIENYIASIMLSVRQPFAPNDFVVIDGREGRVIRLTSRATILMTLDGNHLRIPNAQVFKAVILNYTRNPLRRFDFELGIDANDDPLAAIEQGVAVLARLDFALDDPGPAAWIQQVGDSNIVLFFCAWIDQREASFLKARTAAITTVKNALEGSGFALPEPIYRLRFDGPPTAVPAGEASAASAVERPATRERLAPKTRAPEALDVTPEHDIERQVEEERRQDVSDLLDERARLE